MEKAGHETPEQPQARRTQLDAQVRAIKKSGVVMETDAAALKATGALQTATRTLLQSKYGKGDLHGTYTLDLQLRFPPSVRA